METNNWKRTPGIGMLRRTLFLMATCGIAAFAVLIVRLYQLQIIEHEKFESLAVAQQLREPSLPWHRWTRMTRMVFWL